MAIDPISYKPITLPPPPPIEPKPVEAPAEPAAPAPASEPQKNEVKDGFDDKTTPSATQAALDGAPGKSAPVNEAKTLDVGTIADLGAETGVEKKAATTEKTDGPPPPRQSISGEDAAKKSVELETVDKSRKSTEEAQKKLHEATSGQANELFDMADGKKDAPPNTEVKKTDGGAELVRKNDAGDVVERTVATKQKDGSYLLDSAAYKDGNNVRDRIEANADGSTRAQHADWPGDKNETQDLKNFGDIDRSKDPKLNYTDNKVSQGTGKDKDKLNIEQYSQAGGAASGSKTTYFQDKKIDIDNKLEGPFDKKKPVDRADTYSYSIPAPGADGKQGNPQYQRTQRSSQGDTQATAITDRELDGHKKFAGEGSPSRADLDRVRDEYKKGKGENYDADDAYKKGQTPKQWVVERKKGENSLDTQTFIEGQPKVTTKTHTEVNGNNVTQTSTGTALQPGSKDKYVDIKGETKTSYAKDGAVEKMESNRKEADGTAVEERYDSKREVTDKGLKIDETLESKRTKDGKTYQSKQEDSSLMSGEGTQLLQSKNTTTDPDGRVATAEAGKENKLTVTGPGGKDPREVSSPEDLKNDKTGADLVDNSLVVMGNSIAQFANKGGVNALTAIQGFSKTVADSEVATATKGPLQGKNVPLLPPSLAKFSANTEMAAQALKGSAKGLAGAAGVGAGLLGIANGIQNDNKGAIAKGVVDTLVGGWNGYEAIEPLKGAFKGVTDMDQVLGDSVAKHGGYIQKAADKLGGWLGTPALGEAARKAGTASSVVKVGSALKGLGGAGNVLGAAIGVGTGAWDIAQGVKGGHNGQIAQGVLGVVGGVGGAAAAVLAASAFGGPIGLAAGAVVGGLIFAGQKIAGLIADDAHQIAKLTI